MSDLIVRPVHADEMGHVASLIADILAKNASQQYEALYTRYAEHLLTYPQFSFDNLRVAVYKNRIVSVVHTVDFSLRYGRATLNVVGISFVCTIPKYRGRGFAGAVIKDTLTFAAEQGAHLVLVDSPIPIYFQQFGFSPVWTKYTLQIMSALAAELHQPLQIRVAMPSDIPIMAQMYDHYWGMRVTFERSAELWRWRMNHGRGEALVMFGQSGKIQGYIWHLAEDFSAKNEIVATTQPAIATALAYSGRRWQSVGEETVVWSVPPDDVIVPYAQQMIPLSLNASFSPSAGWLARVIDAYALIDVLLPEIIGQINSSPLPFDVHDLILRIAPDGVEIGLQSIPESICQLSLRDFIQILFGALRPEALAVRHPLSVESIQLLQTIFPARVAAIAGWDWF